MEALAEHHAIHRNTTRTIEIRKIQQAEHTRQLAAKHKWYLKDHHGMIRRLLVPDYFHDEILSTFGMLAITALMCVATLIEQHNSTHINVPLCEIPYAYLIPMLIWMYLL